MDSDVNIDINNENSKTKKEKKPRGGNNCCIPGCFSTSGKGISVFKPTNLQGEFYKNWNEEIYKVLLRFRNDANFLKLREKRKVYVCEKHYKLDDIERTKTGKKSVKLWAIPTLNLPQKSHESATTSRKPPSAREIPIQTPKKSYKDFHEFRKALSKMDLGQWNVKETESVSVVISVKNDCELINNFEIEVDQSMGFSIYVYDWPLPDDHLLYIENRRSMFNISARNLMDRIKRYKLCDGVNGSMNVKEHLVQYERNRSTGEDQRGFQGKKYFRPENCQLLSPTSVCPTCSDLVDQARMKEVKRAVDTSKPLHQNTPLSTVSKDVLISELKEKRKEIKKLQTYIEKLGVSINSAATDDGIFSILESNQDSLSPFVKLFWEEQKKYFQAHPKGRRYHPMLIRFALSIASKSPAAYDELKSSGVIKLPDMRTLRDYRNFVKPRAGFNPGVIEELISEASSLSNSDRFVCLSLDEMKIQSDLVFDRNTGDLIGFTDLGEPDINMGTLKNHDDLATHVLVFYVRGIRSKLKFSFAYFATKGLVAFQLFPIFWRAINILEIRCKLPVITVVCDGASPNRNFFRLHGKATGTDPVHKVKNVFAPDRWIYFLSDVPHLIKTLRNCLWHSKPDGTRSMWNGRCLEWSHISKIVSEQSMVTKVCPKLTHQHINLNSYSVMNVRLAVQTLSKSVSIALYTYYGPETHATAEFCDKINTFFDICNIRCLNEGIRKRKSEMEPFRSKDDPRLTWLTEDFLEYFAKWKENVENREGFTPKEKEKMFISHQTYEGLQITVQSMIEIIKFCLDNGFDFVLTNRFMQDVLGEYFGLHRSMGCRSENPNLHRFGYDENGARAARSAGAV